jgi:4-methylaminobutanoate oxidase (formaldehyde-forming)
MQDSAEIVIVGGGAIGCSIAYHLAKLGKRDVVVLEQSGLTQGATWHAAGLIGQLRGKRNLTRMLQYSVELYGRLEEETGQATDWKPVGSLRLASSEERWREIRHTATTARSFGFELHLVSAEEAQKLFPLMATEGVVGAAYIPSDGYADPSSLTQALAKGARMGGAAFHEGVRVTDFVVKDGRIEQVVTDHGNLRAEVVVNAAGMWARELGALVGVAIPAAAVEHQYLVTEKMTDAPADLPTLRDPDKNFYLKPEVGGIALGGWEDDAPPFGVDGIPPNFARELLESNFDRFEQIATAAAERIPALNEVGIRNLINGPIPVSADGEPVMGPAPGVGNFFVACGFTAGIAACGGAGRALAGWIVEGDPGMDLWAFDIRRFGPHHAGTRYLHERAVESYGRYYKVHWPGEEMRSSRGARRSPLYGVLRDRGAVFGSKFGWERPNWFAPKGVEPVDRPSFERPNWFEQVGNEHRAVRERVALIDVSSFSKFQVSGPGTFRALQWLAANDLDKAPGSITYTQLCNARGGIEADLTITRLAEDRFYIVTGSGSGVRDSGWIGKHMPRDDSAAFTEVTSSTAVLNLCGPDARGLLEKVAEGDVDDKAFPFMTARELHIGYAPVTALRLTYVGELGYELHVPTEYAAHLYEVLWAAGEEFGVANAGYRAIDTLRMEKRYLYWGADITPDYSPYEAGLGFCVKLGKGDFLGREALARIKEAGPTQKLCCFTLEQPTSVFGGEAILRGNEVLGVTSSANYGHTVGKSIVFGYVPAEAAGHEDYEIEAFCARVPAKRHARALYDPERARILA